MATSILRSNYDILFCQDILSLPITEMRVFQGPKKRMGLIKILISTFRVGMMKYLNVIIFCMLLDWYSYTVVNRKNASAMFE